MSEPEQCGIAFLDPDRTTRHMVITCQELVGHAGSHRGFNTDYGYGAIWNHERRLKVHEGGNEQLANQPEVC